MFILKSEMQAIAPLATTKYMWQKQLLKKTVLAPYDNLARKIFHREGKNVSKTPAFCPP